MVTRLSAPQHFQGQGQQAAVRICATRIQDSTHLTALSTCCATILCEPNFLQPRVRIISGFADHLDKTQAISAIGFLFWAETCIRYEMYFECAVHLHRRPQVEFPSLGGKILPETVMLFFAYDLKARLFVEVSRRTKNALRPQSHLFVSRLPRESDAFLNQPLADSQPAGLWFHMQQPQLCDFV